MDINQANAEALDIAIKLIRRQKQIIAAQRTALLCAAAVTIVLLMSL